MKGVISTSKTVDLHCIMLVVGVCLMLAVIYTVVL